MKCALTVVVIFALSGMAPSEAGAATKIGLRVADAADACLVNCSSENASCKRACPTTFNGPCINACDSQAQFCTQNCQRK